MLHVRTVLELRDPGVVDDPERDRAGLVPHGVGGEHVRSVHDRSGIALEVRSRTNRVRVRQAIARIDLAAVREAGALDVRRYAIEDEVQVVVREKGQLRVAAETSNLVVELVPRPLEREDVVMTTRLEAEPWFEEHPASATAPMTPTSTKRDGVTQKTYWLRRR